VRETIILDTGPLVAWLSAKDTWHSWACAQFAILEPPLVTCEAVLVEACFLCARGGGNPAGILGKVSSGVLNIGLEISDEAAALEVLINRYADTPMSLADACLVRLAEIHRNCRLFTLDSDFKHYRRYGRNVIPLLCP
jgi:predicted nucleic acid-binding protein